MERTSSSVGFPDSGGTEPGLHSLRSHAQLQSGEAPAFVKEEAAPTTSFFSLYPEPQSAGSQFAHKQVLLPGAEPGAKRRLEPALSYATATIPLPSKTLSSWTFCSMQQQQEQQQLQQHFTTPIAQPLGTTSKMDPLMHQQAGTAATTAFQLDGEDPLLGLQHQASFTIPAFKCLTEEDLILTDELEGGGMLDAAFGELADASKLGFLPSEEDLKLQLFEPTPPPAALLAPAPHPTLFTPFFYDSLSPTLGMPLRRGPFGLQQQAMLQSMRQQQQQAGAAAGGLQGLVKAGVGEEEGGEEWEADDDQGGSFEGEILTRQEIDSYTPPSRSSSLGSIKRRMDAIELEDQGSARSVKRRSNSIGSFLAWEAGAAAATGSPIGSTGGGDDFYRAASAPHGMSRFSMEANGGAWRSLSPSPAPTPVRRVEQAPPAKTTPSRPAAARSTAAAVTAAAALEPMHGSSSGNGSSGSGTAVYKGVSKHKLTQRWEASLWLTGRQLYLGGFDNQEDAARAYDIAALACKGEGTETNFPPSDYVEQMQEVEGLTRDEVVAYVRRRSSAFSRGKSRFRGVSGHEGRWEARIGSFLGRKNVSFGIFESEEDAARQYDRALILEKGRAAKTNFPMRDYEREVAEYEAYVLARCRSFASTEAADIADDYTLPLHRTVTPEDRKRQAVIYAEDLRQRLHRG